ncbi:hypothetical protein F4802DRAFT_595952 [Xylaria palmicola]|nr:hypothetical protein F4802DRAFT_595952 [Xylaria palmicola]
MAAEAKASPPLCTRCREHDGVLDLRSDAVCPTCFATFVASKAVKRLEVLQRETRGPRLPSRPQRYLVALSRGPSSAALLHVLTENARRQREQNQRPKFELVPVFVDLDLDGEGRTATTSDAAPPPPLRSGADSATGVEGGEKEKDTQPHGQDPPVDPFVAHFPDTPIDRVSLSSIFSSPGIDWSALPLEGDEGSDASSSSPSPPPRRLAGLLSRLPTASARADVARLLTRHALLAAAAARGCDVVLLGHSTTSLAELTLSEAAKGRGAGIPWLVNDGAFPLPRGTGMDPSSPPTDPTAATEAEATASSSSSSSIHVYSPLREIFRKEIHTYLSIVRTAAGPLSDLFPDLSLSPHSSSSAPPSSSSSAAPVVSHRDLSLDDVVARYFVGVEASYPSVVANVVRTTGKLSRTLAGAGAGAGNSDEDEEDGARLCGLCGVRLDPRGDERWRGEIGEADAVGKDGDGDSDGDVLRNGRRRNRLCYGCERSIKG